MVAAFFAVCEDCQAETSAVWAINEWACHSRAIKRLRETDSELSWLMEHHRLESAVEKRLLTRPPKRFVAPVQPPRLNARMALQQGLFVCLGDPGSDLFANLAPDVESEQPLQIVKIEFPRTTRGDVLKGLRRLNIRRDTLFPGLDGLAQSLAHRLVPTNLKREALLQLMGRPDGWPA
jgi:hypothetical protein